MTFEEVAKQYAEKVKPTMPRQTFEKVQNRLDVLGILIEKPLEEMKEMDWLKIQLFLSADQAPTVVAQYTSTLTNMFLIFDLPTVQWPRPSKIADRLIELKELEEEAAKPKKWWDTIRDEPVVTPAADPDQWLVDLAVEDMQKHPKFVALKKEVANDSE